MAGSQAKVPSKRRAPPGKPSASKKLKIHHNADNLPWKSVRRPVETGVGGDDGILELEEVDGVEVVYEDTDGGRVARFKVADQVESEMEPDAEVLPGLLGPEDSNTIPTPGPEEDEFDSETLLPNWHAYSLHPQLLRSLHEREFTFPTPIQAASLPHALAGRDIVGIAQTGSGKTLAYGLPILHHILSQPGPGKGRRKLKALILAPTRELALQVSSHLNECLNVLHNQDLEKVKRVGLKAPPRVSVAAVVGGMSTQKQRRILDRGVDILVATPGRLWDILEDDDTLAKEMKHLRFLVLDEADRMIEAGHFAELENILRLTLRESLDDQIQEDFEGQSETGPERTARENEPKDHLQTFVFSATLSKELQRNVKKRSRPKSAGKYRKNEQPASTLDDLLLRLDFRDPDPEVIDLSPVGSVVATLKESKIECLAADKDVYLYYFLLRYPGRSLVFLSSIDGIRRLMPLAEMLELKAFPLHSQLEQRQRLKNLDRFKSTSNSVLLATDIAARGLDIPAVDHVIHYQIPRSADSYVHRNGRTARASRKGFSMLMCAPDERRVVRALLGKLGRQENEIPEMSVELNLLDKLKVRVQLARKIEQTQHKIKKENHERNWMKETAEAMEIQLDSDFASDSDEDRPSKQKRKAKNAKNAALKAELKRLLSQPLIARGLSARYITSGSTPIVDELIAGEFNETMLGLRKTEAGDDLAPAKRTKRPPTPQEFEEWNGIGS